MFPNQFGDLPVFQVVNCRRVLCPRNSAKCCTQHFLSYDRRTAQFKEQWLTRKEHTDLCCASIASQRLALQ